MHDTEKEVPEVYTLEPVLKTYVLPGLTAQTVAYTVLAVDMNFKRFSPDVPVISKQPYELDVPDIYVFEVDTDVAVVTSIRYGFPQFGLSFVFPTSVRYTFIG